MPVATLQAAIDQQPQRAPIPFQLNDKLPVGSPEWWLKRLMDKLDQRATQMQQYDEYYDGTQPLEFATRKFREAFGELFADFSDNFAAVVVDAVDERLDIEGFRIPLKDDQDASPETQADEDVEQLEDETPDADGEAWRIWQANHLDAESQLAHNDALVKGCAYLHVSPFKNDWIDDSTPGICVEDAAQCYVELARGGRRNRRAAIRRWVDDSGCLFVNIYLPDALYKFQTKNRVVDAKGNPRATGQNAWLARQDPLLPDDSDSPNEPWPLPYPKGFTGIPIVPLENRPRLSKEGKSELAEVISVQDAINKTCSDMLLASEFGAFGQKHITNFRLEIDPATGQPKQPFKMGVDRLLVAGPPKEGDPPAEFGEFSPTPLEGYVLEIGMLVQHLASITRTPPHYFLANMGNFPSGEALKSAEAGLVTKASRRQRVFGEAWEEALRLVFILLDDPRGQSVQSETIWRDPETQSESEHVDAQMKQSALGVPLQQIWKNLGYTPQQIARFVAMRQQEAEWGLSPNITTKGVTEAGPPMTPGQASVAAGMTPSAVMPVPAEPGMAPQ